MERQGTGFDTVVKASLKTLHLVSQCKMEDGSPSSSIFLVQQVKAGPWHLLWKTRLLAGFASSSLCLCEQGMQNRAVEEMQREQD